jgi:hypothetical protein
VFDHSVYYSEQRNGSIPDVSKMLQMFGVLFLNKKNGSAFDVPTML